MDRKIFQKHKYTFFKLSQVFCVSPFQYNENNNQNQIECIACCAPKSFIPTRNLKQLRFDELERVYNTFYSFIPMFAGALANASAFSG